MINQSEPLTQAEVDTMHFVPVTIYYPDGSEEPGIVLYGKIYSIETLDGAGLEGLLLDATGYGGDTLDRPSGTYDLYLRCPAVECKPFSWQCGTPAENGYYLVLYDCGSIGGTMLWWESDHWEFATCKVPLEIEATAWIKCPGLPSWVPAKRREV